MDVNAVVAQLQTERPALIPALRAAIASTPDRTALNTVLEHLLQMQQTIDAKRAEACSMLRPGVGLRSDAQFLRHIPDVMIRKLCRIAEVAHVTTATPEWLDKMEKRGE